MKLSIATVILAGCALLLASCSAKPKVTKQKETGLGGTIYKDTVHLSTAINDIQNYVSACDRYFNDSVPIRSYTINKSDLFGVLGVTSVPECRFEHCRVYIGVDDANKFKLYMTPTVLGPNPNGSKDSIYIDQLPYDRTHKTQFVYDLNAPCPSTCDKSSKLYLLK